MKVTQSTQSSELSSVKITDLEPEFQLSTQTIFYLYNNFLTTSIQLLIPFEMSFWTYWPLVPAFISKANVEEELSEVIRMAEYQKPVFQIFKVIFSFNVKNTLTQELC